MQKLCSYTIGHVVRFICQLLNCSYKRYTESNPYEVFSRCIVAIEKLYLCFSCRQNNSRI